VSSLLKNMRGVLNDIHAPRESGGTKQQAHVSNVEGACVAELTMQRAESTRDGINVGILWAP